MICTDWEMSEAWRRWNLEYGNDWESKLRQRFEQDMIEKYDTHSYVGTSPAPEDVDYRRAVLSAAKFARCS